MRLGVIKAVVLSGERVLLDVQIDEARYREVALLHPVGLRIRVAAGDRVLVGQVEDNADALFAWPVTFSREVEPAIDIVGDQVWARSPNGTAVALATKADLEAHKDHFDQHQHAGLLGGTGSIPALTSTPTKSNAGTPPDPAPDPEGTTVFFAE